MKITTPLAIAVVLFAAVTPSWAQCSGGGSFNPGYSTPTCSVSTPYYEPAEPSPPPTEAPFGEEPYLEGSGAPVGAVDYAVQVQHPVTFAWKTVKTFKDPTLADAYADQIEARHWVTYLDRAQKTKYAEAKSLTQARATASALRRTGATIKAINPFQVEVAEESLQNVFDEAIETVAITPEPSKVPNALQPLLGLWEAVTQTADGQLSRILLALNPDGTAELTAPTAAGGEVKINRDFAVEEGEFKLTDGANELVLGNVLEAVADKVVLERNGAKITFLRP